MMTRNQSLLLRQDMAASRAPLPTSTTTAIDSPTSLLWAHQLRREHKALVSNLSSLESSTTTFTTSTTRSLATLGSRLDALEATLVEIWGEIGELKQALVQVR